MVEPVPVRGRLQMLGEVARELVLGVPLRIGAGLHGVPAMGAGIARLATSCAVEGATRTVACDLLALCRGAEELPLGGRLEGPRLAILLQQTGAATVGDQNPRGRHELSPIGAARPRTVP